MGLHLIGVDENLKQVYQCDRPDCSSKQANALAEEILKADHIKSVLVFESKPNVTQIDESFLVKYRFNYLFGIKK